MRRRAPAVLAPLLWILRMHYRWCRRCLREYAVPNGAAGVDGG